MLVKPPGRRKNVRRIVRRSFRQSGKVHVDDQAALAIKSVNLSVSGMGFISPRALAVGLPCSIAIEIREKSRSIELQANGTITYSVPSGLRHYRCGIAFNDNNQRTIALIAQITLLAPDEPA